MHPKIRELCSKIQDETDARKLYELVLELRALLDQHFQERGERRDRVPPNTQ